MTASEIISIITALGTLVTAILAGAATIIAALAKREASDAKAQTMVTHTAVNSRMEEFKKLFEKVFFDKGRLAEKTEQESVTAGVAEAVAREVLASAAVVPIPVVITEGPGTAQEKPLFTEAKPKK